MWPDNSAQEIADLFWQLSGVREDFPHRLERALAFALPVTLVKLPRLRLWDIERWLSQRGKEYRFDCDSRSVRGCLLAHAGVGLLFVDGSDLEDEQRFTVAHEIGHFMADYWLPRRKAIEKLSSDVVDALDGSRPLTLTERIYAMLSSVPSSTYQSLMERNSLDGNDEIWKAEDRADCIALALLAPSQEIIELMDFLMEPYPTRLERTADILCLQFGLPKRIAGAYASALLAKIGKGPSWIEYLGIS